MEQRTKKLHLVQKMITQQFHLILVEYNWSFMVNKLVDNIVIGTIANTNDQFSLYLKVISNIL